MSNKQAILNFLKTEQLAVLATLSPEHTPQAALIGFGVTDDLTFIFGTNNASRKFRNIQKNHHVALVIGWANRITVQVEEIVKVLSEDNAQRLKEVYYQKNPTARKYQHEPGETYFTVKPTWIRYTDVNKDLWEIFELKL